MACNLPSLLVRLGLLSACLGCFGEAAHVGRERWGHSAVRDLEQQQFDPLNDFCRRFAHQTAVIDDKLYIDGGLVDYGGHVNPDTVNYTNTYLLYLELDQLEANFPVEYANLTKPSYVPSVQGGVLWPDTVNKVFYLFGGEYNWTTLPPSQFTLWQYDTLYDAWNATTPDDSVSDIQSVSFGAGVAIDDRALGFYYGGWLSNATVLGWNGNPIAQSGLIRYDMLANSWSNVTFVDSTPRAEGVMFYIPASDAGMLVYFGGVQQMSNGSYAGSPLNQIYLYDVASGKSYSQSTSGTAPGDRRRFCGGVSWPEDQSSYNIYFYGGLPPYNEQGMGYGDVWILTLPSFTWIQWYPSSGEHHSLSCNVIDQSQMIIMGGYFPNSSNIDCDAKNIWGQHNLNLGANDVEQAEWYQYLSNLTTYQVPSNITEIIGGSPAGGATLTSPSAGWGDPDLEVYFGRKYTATPRTPTRVVSTSAATSPGTATSTPQPASHTSIGAIVGGVVGGVGALVAIVLITWLCLRHRKKRRAATAQGQPQHTGPMTELGGPGSHPNGSPQPVHKRDYSGSTFQGSSAGASPPTMFSANQWSYPQPQAQTPPVRHQQFTPQQGGQMSSQYFNPPPPAQQYYPPPPAPQQYDKPPSPPLAIPEMSSVRSPPIAEGPPGRKPASPRG